VNDRIKQQVKQIIKPQGLTGQQAGSTPDDYSPELIPTKAHDQKLNSITTRNRLKQIALEDIGEKLG
jgi:hypothetical protein